MKLRRLDDIEAPGVEAVPGLDFGPGLNLVYGLNGRGKTALGRIIHEAVFGSGNARRGQATMTWMMESPAPRRLVQRYDGAEAKHPSSAQLPSPMHAASFFLRATDLLVLQGEHDPQLSRALQRAMAGGIHLADLRARQEVRLPRREPRRMAEARTALRACEDHQRQLGRREEDLEALLARLEEAKILERQRPGLESRLRRLEHARGLAAVQAELEDLPAALTELEPDAAATRNRLLRQVDQATEDLENRLRQLDALEDRRAALGLERRPLADDQRDELDLLVRQLAQETRRRDDAEERLQVLRSQLPRPVADRLQKPLDVGSEELRLLARALDRKRRLLAKRAGLRDIAALHRRLVEAAQESSERRASLEDLMRLRLLQERKSTPGLVVAAGVLGLCALVAALLVPDAVPSRIATVVVASAMTVCLGGLVLEGRRRQAQRSLATRLGLGHRESEDEKRLEDALRSVEEELQAKSLAAEARTRLRALRDDLRLVETALVEVESEIRDRNHEIGLDLDQEFPLLGLAHYDDLLRRQKIRAESRALEAQRDHAEDGLDGCWSRAADLARSAGVRLPDDVEHLERFLLRVADQDEHLKALQGEIASAEAESKRRQEILREAQVELDEFHARLGLESDDLEGFQRLLLQAPRYRALLKSQAELQALHDHESPQPGDDGALEDDDPRELQDRLRALERRLDEAAALPEEIGRIRAEIDQCRQGDAHERALFESDSARQELEKRRSEALRSLIKNFILEDLMREFEADLEPQVFRRARALLESFTRSRYQLISASGQEILLREVASGQTRRLSQLSDGTRLQLLMATRLAFAESIEGAEKLPLILDEVLINADRERFSAIAEVLLTEAARGRQIIYLTANADDVALLQELGQEKPEARTRVLELDRLPGKSAAAQQG